MSFLQKRLCSRLYESVCVFSWPHTHTTKQIQRIRSAAERLSFSPAATVTRTTCDNRVIVGRQMAERPLDSPIVGGMK